MNRKGKKRFKGRFFIPLFCLLPPFVLFFRAPVVVVTDRGFIALYGPQRPLQERFLATLRLFRPVYSVTLSETIPESLVPTVIQKSLFSPVPPYCVVFSPGLKGPAGAYGRQFPRIPVLIGELENRKEDFYRAGLLAAQVPRQFGESVVVYADSRVWNAGKGELVRGLREKGDPRDPVYIGLGETPPAKLRPSCIIIASPRGDYPDFGDKIPTILFSWIDPRWVPRNVVAIFDDSPWALLVPLVRRLAQKGTVLPISTLILLHKPY